MGEQHDGEFLKAAGSNSAQKCLKTVWYFSEIFRRKKSSVKKVVKYKLLYHYILTFSRRTHGTLTVRQGTQYVQLNNTEQENKKHQANLLAWLKWEAFLVLKKTQHGLLLLQVMFFSQTLERSSPAARAGTHKGFPSESAGHK